MIGACVSLERGLGYAAITIVSTLQIHTLLQSIHMYATVREWDIIYTDNNSIKKVVD